MHRGAMCCPRTPPRLVIATRLYHHAKCLKVKVAFVHLHKLHISFKSLFGTNAILKCPKIVLNFSVLLLIDPYQIKTKNTCLITATQTAKKIILF